MLKCSVSKNACTQPQEVGVCCVWWLLNEAGGLLLSCAGITQWWNIRQKKTTSFKSFEFWVIQPDLLLHTNKSHLKQRGHKILITSCQNKEQIQHRRSQFCYQDRLYCCAAVFITLVPCRSSAVGHLCSRSVVYSLDLGVTAAPRFLHWVFGCGFGSSAVQSVQDSAAASAEQTADLCKNKSQPCQPSESSTTLTPSYSAS